MYRYQNLDQVEIGSFVVTSSHFNRLKSLALEELTELISSLNRAFIEPNHHLLHLGFLQGVYELDNSQVVLREDPFKFDEGQGCINFELA